MKKHLWSVVFAVALTAFTVYIALDTFVISAVYNDSAGIANTEMFAMQEKTESIGADAVQTSDSYSDENINITLTEYERYGTKIYVADVTLSSAQYLKTAFADNTYGKNITAKTSSIAGANSAILAVNGDYYGARERGYVIRNGVVYRSTAAGCDIMCIYADGSMEIVSDGDYTAEQLVQKGVWQALSFGPGLIENGSVTARWAEPRRATREPP